MNELHDADVFSEEHIEKTVQRVLETVWESHKDDFIKATPVVSKNGEVSLGINVDTGVLLDFLYAQIISDGVVDIPEHIKTADDFRTWLMEDSDESKN